ncbi:hypothetical protein [Nonomuraea jabiensis]|uniref:hypothetical protein n=1 Tax=Nonomuraea jabiensis TaxID=882448 RepID=UPI003D72D67B
MKRPVHQPADAAEAALLDAALPDNPQMGDHQAQLKLGRLLKARGQHEAADYWFFYAAMGGLYDLGDPFER